jgi:hypothetical protein
LKSFNNLKPITMKVKQLHLLIACLPLLFMGCNKTTLLEQEPNTDSSSLDFRTNAGATQIDGIGYYAEAAECDYPGEGADFALLLTGDLEGCLYVFVESFDCSPSGAYREEGREYFVGTYNGAAGTFWTTYQFRGKFEGCAEDGSFIGAEIFGRCQHPIVSGSGTGVFEGVSGRLDFKDDIASGTFPYRGHLRY